MPAPEVAPLRRARVQRGFTVRSLGDMRYARHRQAALARAGAPEPDARLPRQVHGSGISLLTDGAHPRSDGWIIDEPGKVVGVVVADCLPIWIWDRAGRAAGVFHAGWRGLAAGLPAQAAAELVRRLAARPEDLLAAVGPHAGACCYRVGPEVARRFRRDSVLRRGGELLLDLGGEARAQLLEAGLRPESLEVSSECTICRPEAYFSYRREGGRGSRCGHMLAYLWLAEEA